MTPEMEKEVIESGARLLDVNGCAKEAHRLLFAASPELLFEVSHHFGHFIGEKIYGKEVDCDTALDLGGLYIVSVVAEYQNAAAN